MNKLFTQDLLKTKTGTMRMSVGRWYYHLLIYSCALLIGFTAGGTTFTCLTPKKGGTFTITLKSFTETCGEIKVNIPAGKTAAEKAALIVAKINNSCAGVFSATANGADVTVTNAVHNGQKVFFKFGKDDTGEKDRIIASLEPGSYEGYYASVSPMFTCSLAATGISVDSIGPGKIYIGTSSYVAEVTTFAGQSPYDILNNARTQLINNGVQGIFLGEVSEGTWGLSFRVQPTDTFLEFGDDDSGTECSFEMFEPPAVQFHQLGFDLDGTITNNSEWGALDLTFIGTDQIMYLNMTVDTAWVIENMPVLSTRGVGIDQTQRFWFDIGFPGDLVSELTYSLTLTPTIAGKPSYMSTAPVSSDWVRIFSGFTGGPPGGGGPGPAEKQKGGAAVDPAPKLHENFPNQECPANYCVPAGVSNSLQWLNTKNGLGMNAGDISIGSLANAFGTTAANGTQKNTIYDNKKKYCKKKKLPITTRKFSGSRIADVANEIKNGQDVELMVDWIGQGGKGHCVAVTGITDHGNGKYSLVITHDKEQNQAGGTVDENATYDKKAKKWSGALANASGLSENIMYLVECPVVTSRQTSNYLPGGSSHKLVNDAYISYDHGRYQVKNLELTGYINNNPPPPPGQMTVFSMSCLSLLEVSADSGVTFQDCFAPCQGIFRAHHTLDSMGVEYYQTEILQLTLEGGSLPEGMIIRECMQPQDSSTGMMRLKAIPGGFQISSFFDVFTELSVDGGGMWLRDDNETTVLYATGPSVLPDLSLQNILIGNTENICYDASSTIVVAGDGGPFIVPPGGAVNMIAGTSIFYLHGTTVMEGGYLHGSISSDGQYCPGPPFTPLQDPTLTNNEQESHYGKEGFLSYLYPNPANTSFTAELRGDETPQGLFMEIYDAKGIRLMSSDFHGQKRKTIDISSFRSGIYLVRIVTPETQEIFKLIKL